MIRRIRARYSSFPEYQTLQTPIRYRIRHSTHYEYSAPVAICQNHLRMMPRSMKTLTTTVECHESQVEISPSPSFRSEHVDYFGNRVLCFTIESLHQELTVTATSEVSVCQHRKVEENTSLAWEKVRDDVARGRDSRWLEAQEFVFDSPRIARGADFAEFAQVSFLPGREVVEATRNLTRRIHSSFRYDVTATDVNTSTDEALALRAGVCQDFAHVQIACLRSLGIPARYVSGYLRTAPPPGIARMVGADESHAWVSVYCGSQLGWIDFDPTNNCVAETNHIPICVGRDYSEVSPMRGVVIGGGTTALSVHVDVDSI
ncbi:MAG: transglutaminase family protein [Planctomycetales bacterium]|nr:transglutaminase family protein [Planctomycetales bacterium]